MIRKTREHGRAYTFSPFLLERFTKFSTLKKKKVQYTILQEESNTNHQSIGKEGLEV
jgi:hypothetical protein